MSNENFQEEVMDGWNAITKAFEEVYLQPRECI